MGENCHWPQNQFIKFHAEPKISEYGNTPIFLYFTNERFMKFNYS